MNTEEFFSRYDFSHSLLEEFAAPQEISTVFLTVHLYNKTDETMTLEFAAAELLQYPDFECNFDLILSVKVVGNIIKMHLYSDAYDEYYDLVIMSDDVALVDMDGNFIVE